MRCAAPALPLDGSATWLEPDAALAVHARAVLETRPGRVPWSPAFGCDLGGLVGRPATPQTLDEARWRVADALQRWLIGVEVIDIRVEATPIGEQPAGGAGRAPLAETSLLGLGAECALVVALTLRTPDGPRGLRAVLVP